jgi:hypothetical protein
MTTRIKTRHDTAANWLSVNPVLALGEAGVETDTRKVKYGDGVTSWTDLLYASEPNQFDYQFTDGVNNNSWHVVTVTGAKEFDYDTPGHKYTVIANTGTLTGVTSYSVDSTVYNMEYVDVAIANGSNIHIYVNNDHSSRISVNTVNTTSTVNTYTFNFSTPISVAPGDEVTIEAWYRGTQQVWDRYNYWETVFPDASATTTNTVVIDTTHFQYDPGWAYMWEQQLPNNVANHSIVFDQWGTGIDTRNITAVTTSSNGLVTITFDGAPRDVNAVTLANTITTTPTNAVQNWSYLTFSKTQFPEFKDCAPQWQLWNSDGYYTDDTGHPYYNNPRSGYVIIDGGSPINFQFWTGNTDNNDNWEIYLRSNATWTSTSTLEVHWYRRASNITLDVYDPNNESPSDGYRWFDWRTDLPQIYHPESGNGVESGRMMVSCKVYAPEVNDEYHMSYNLDFVQTGNYTYDPYDPSRNQYAYNYTFFGDSTPFDRFDPYGISFTSYYGPNNTWTTSTRLKVRIIYKMELIVTESTDLEYFC